MRQSGILLHITSLPSAYGIGTLGPEAFRFLDFLAAAGQKCWQLLPLGPTGLGDSPYQAFSAFGGNPYCIDLELLIREGLLEPGEPAALFWGEDPAQADYAAVYRGRRALLRRAFARFRPDGAYGDFVKGAAYWLEDYALYGALKERFGGGAWTDWPEDIRLRRPEALKHWRLALGREMDFQRFVQYAFFRQWQALRRRAGEKGVRLIGDVSFYVPLDSADVWANPGLFQLDGEGRPTQVAGVPPDYFSQDGQLWGNPLYDWQAMERDGFSWWANRIQNAGTLFDVVRIDHFRALEAYWAVPAGEGTARNGRWLPGPGRAFIDRIKAAGGGMEFIAEDLGFLTPEVHRLREYAGWPGMKVLQFAFSPDGGSPYLPHRYDANCVCYTGTHDNETLSQWWDGLDGASRDFAAAYLGLNREEGPRAGILRGGMSSVAERFICPMQDWLGLGREGRMNTPGQAAGCWRWRLRPGALTPALGEEIREITARYGR